MNPKLSLVLHQWEKPFLTGTDLQLLLDKSPSSRYGIIKRAFREGALIPLKRDLYLIESQVAISPPDAFEIASLLYGPSYISFESALSFHGWIPEAVMVTTSGCSKRSKEFETAFGVFSFYHVPITIFSMGVKHHMRAQNSMLMAEPWKAIADYIYVKKRQWKNLKELSEDMRIDRENLMKSDKELLFLLSENYPSNRVKKVLKSILKGF